MVPVLDKDLNPLMPCKERRARTMMEKGRAKPYWKDGIFCIILQEEPSARNYQDIVVGIDPGSKREGFTVATEQRVVMNITSNAITHVKDKLQTRKKLRHSRRQRKSPYRKNRNNRKSLFISKLNPSSKSRWDAKLRIVKMLKNILPITDISIEDVKAKTIKNCTHWNVMFDYIEKGKNYFYSQLDKLHLNLYKWSGYDTYLWRSQVGYKKTSNKLKDSWTAHNVDSHCLCEMFFGYYIEPITIMCRLIFLTPIKRSLFKANTLIGNIRRRNGGSMSLGLKKGTLVKSTKFGLCIVGGNDGKHISLHDIHTNKRLSQNVKVNDVAVISYNIKWYLNQIT